MQWLFCYQSHRTTSRQANSGGLEGTTLPGMRNQGIIVATLPAVCKTNQLTNLKTLISQFCCRVKLFNKLTVSLKESQRLFPSVPLIARTTSEDCQLGMLLLFYVSYLFIPTYLLFCSLVRVLMHVFTTSTFDVEVRLFSNRSQTSKCGKNISCTLEYRLMCNCRRSCNISTSTV